MMQKVVKSGLIGGLVLFIWGAIFWTMLPWQKNQMKSFTNEQAVQSAIASYSNGSGLYVVPNMGSCAKGSKELDAAKSRMSTGPYATVAVKTGGTCSSMAGCMVAGLIVKVVLASLATWLLLHSTQALTFKKSVRFLTLIGVIAAIAATMPYVIWFGFPAGFAIGSMIESISGWFLAGLAISKLLLGKSA